MKKTVLVLSLEFAAIILVIAVFLFIFKIFPFNPKVIPQKAIDVISPSPAESKINDSSPISVNSTNVKSANIVYQFTGKVKSIVIQNNGFYSVVFEEAPNDIVSLSAVSSVAKQNKSIEFVKIDSVRPGDSIIVYGSYNLKTKGWIDSKISFSQKSAVTVTPQVQKTK